MVVQAGVTAQSQLPCEEQWDSMCLGIQRNIPLTFETILWLQNQTGVSVHHHESPDTQASDQFPSPRFRPHPPPPPKDCAEVHNDWPLLEERWLVTTPTMVGRNFKVLSSAQDTPHSVHQISKTLLLTALSSVMWQVKATPGSSLVGSWASALPTTCRTSLPVSHTPVGRRWLLGEVAAGEELSSHNMWAIKADMCWCFTTCREVSNMWNFCWFSEQRNMKMTPLHIWSHRRTGVNTAKKKKVGKMRTG